MPDFGAQLPQHGVVSGIRHFVGRETLEITGKQKWAVGIIGIIALLGALPPAFCDGGTADKPMKALTLDAGVRKSGKLNLEHAVFYYKTDEEVRFADKKTNFQSKNRGNLPPAVAAQLASEAYEESSVEQELTLWRYHGGPAPNVITAKAHLYNESSQARLNTHLNTTLRAKVAPLLVDPKTLLVDFRNLNTSGKWVALDKRSTLVPALAAGEDSREEVSRFDLRAFLAKHPNDWPVELEITVKCPESGQTVKKRLTLIPDHFVVPTLY